MGVGGVCMSMSILVTLGFEPREYCAIFPALFILVFEIGSRWVALSDLELVILLLQSPR